MINVEQQIGQIKCRDHAVKTEEEFVMKDGILDCERRKYSKKFGRGHAETTMKARYRCKLRQNTGVHNAFAGRRKGHH